MCVWIEFMQWFSPSSSSWEKRVWLSPSHSNQMRREDRFLLLLSISFSFRLLMKKTSQKGTWFLDHILCPVSFLNSLSSKHPFLFLFILRLSLEATNNNLFQSLSLSLSQSSPPGAREETRVLFLQSFFESIFTWNSQVEERLHVVFILDAKERRTRLSFLFELFWLVLLVLPDFCWKVWFERFPIFSIRVSPKE